MSAPVPGAPEAWRGRWRAIIASPWFWVALAVKVVLAATCASYFLRDLFIPFVGWFVASGGADPWHHFGALGAWNTFPYPPAMLYALALPRALLGGWDGAAGLLIARLPLLAADLAILALLVRWFPDAVRHVVTYYWCSPILIYACYWHGQLDVLPTAWFVGALALLRAGSPHYAAAVLGVALASKSHLFAALPFLAAYLHQERGALGTARFFAIALGAYGALLLPFASDPAFQRMVFGTEEQARLFATRLEIGNGMNLLLAPGAIALLWFVFVSHAKRNWDLLMLYMALLFGVFTLLTPPAPGYFLWSLPFLVYLMCRSVRFNPVAYATYTLGYLAFFLLANPAGVDDVLQAWLPVAPLAPPMRDAVFTLMQAAFAAVVLLTAREAVRSNAIYKARRRPILIGVSGDSGAGKDTLAGLLAQLFPQGRTLAIAGDDYHRWERGNENWRVYTHLDVRANDVHRQLADAVALVNGETIRKVTYDHGTGRFTDLESVAPNEVVIFQGLHALSLEDLRSLYDLKVFVDPEEDLRREWKVRRDVDERGHAEAQVRAALDMREPDRMKYIVPQREQADVIVRWRREAPEAPLDLEVVARNSFDLDRVVAALRAAGAAVDHDPYLDARWQRLLLGGSAAVAAELHVAAAAATIPNLDELAPRPAFRDGLPGGLQLVLLACLSARLRRVGV